MRILFLLAVSWFIPISEMGLFSQAHAYQPSIDVSLEEVAKRRAFELACQGKFDEAKQIFSNFEETDSDLQMALLALKLWHSQRREQALLAGNSQLSGMYSIPLRRLFRQMSNKPDDAQWKDTDTRLSMWIAGTLVPHTAGNGWRYLRLCDLEQSRGMKAAAHNIMDIASSKLGKMTSHRVYEDSPDFDTLRRYQMLAAHYIVNGDLPEARGIISKIAETTVLADAVASFRFVNNPSRQSALQVIDSMKDTAGYDKFRVDSIAAMKHDLPTSQGRWTSPVVSSSLVSMFTMVSERTRQRRADLVDPELAAALLDTDELASLARQYLERQAENELAILLFDCDENFCPREVLIHLLGAKSNSLRALAVEKLIAQSIEPDEKVIECLVQLANSEDPSARYAGLALFAKARIPAPDSIRNSHHESDDADVDRLLRLLKNDKIEPGFVSDACSGDNSWIQSLVVSRALEEGVDPTLWNSCLAAVGIYGTEYAVIVAAECDRSKNEGFGTLRDRLSQCSESQSSEEIRRRAQTLLTERHR